MLKCSIRGRRPLWKLLFLQGIPDASKCFLLDLWGHSGLILQFRIIVQTTSFSKVVDEGSLHVILYRRLIVPEGQKLTAHIQSHQKNKKHQTLNGTHAWLDAFFFGFGPVFSQQSILGSCICPTEVLAALKLDNRVLLPPLLHHCCSTTHCLHLKTIDVSVKLRVQNINRTACTYQHLYRRRSKLRAHSHPVARPSKRFWALLLLDTKDKIQVNGLSFWKHRIDSNQWKNSKKKSMKSSRCQLW